MNNIHPASGFIRKTAWLILIICCLGASFAAADGVMPKMPPPPDIPVYWQLAEIEHAPEVKATGRYSVQYDVTGLSPDLEDGLMAESLLENEDAAQGISLIIAKNDEVVMEHNYIWNPLPIYLEPDTVYPITVTGTQTTNASTPNSLLGVYEQGDLVARVSAGSYAHHENSASFEIDTTRDIYKDGSIVISMILRDVNDMFRDRIVFTYTMQDGIKPVPTPVPGFSPVELTTDVKVPSFYVPVEGQDNLWTIVTAPEEYRSYGSMSGSEPAFFPADKSGNVVMNERPAFETDDFAQHVEGFVADFPEDIPVHYTVKGNAFTFTTRDGEVISRTFGRIDGGEPAFYPVEEDGSVNVETAQAIDPEEDFTVHIEGFGAANPETVPGHYIEVENGLYSFKGRDGETRYRAYGRLNGAEPAFYPSDENGAVDMDEKPVTPEKDFDTFIKGFDSVEPKKELPDYYTVVQDGLYAVEDREGNLVYRVFGIKDGGEPAFYPADEEGNLIDEENAEPVATDDDFEQFIAGFETTKPADVPDYYEATETPGVWTFEDKDGAKHFRVFGKLHRGESAFYPADETGVVADDALPVEPAADLATMPPPVFVPKVPDSVPFYYTPVKENETVHSFTDVQGDTNYRTYGAYGKGEEAFYPADQSGTPEESSEPVDIDTEYAQHFGSFEPQAPATVPTRYTIVDGKEGLYAFTDRENEKVFRVFGAPADGEAAFYPADSEGNITSGVPVNPDDDLQVMPGVVADAVVVTLAPSPEAENTPIARMQEAGINGWFDPKGPRPTQYNATVVPTEGQDTSKSPAATLMITPSPEAIVDASPTAYDATILTQSTDPATAGIVSQNVTPAATETVAATENAATEAPTSTAAQATVSASAETTETVTTTTGAETTSPETEETVPTTEDPAESASPAPTETPAELENTSNTGVIIGIVVAVVAVLGGGGFFLLKRSKKDPS